MLQRKKQWVKKATTILQALGNRQGHQSTRILYDAMGIQLQPQQPNSQQHPACHTQTFNHSKPKIRRIQRNTGQIINFL